jgi:hypothetical protein
MRDFEEARKMADEIRKLANEFNDPLGPLWETQALAEIAKFLAEVLNYSNTTK